MEGRWSLELSEFAHSRTKSKDLTDKVMKYRKYDKKRTACNKVFSLGLPPTSLDLDQIKDVIRFKKRHGEGRLPANLPEGWTMYHRFAGRPDPPPPTVSTADELTPTVRLQLMKNLLL